MRTRSFRLVLCALLALTAGCMSSNKEPEATWRSTEVSAVSERILWTFALNSLQVLDYPVGTGANPSTLEVETGWRTSLAPFRGDGRRHRAIVRLHPVGERRWEIEARVATQANMALANPLDPRHAEWEWRPDDVIQADILLTQIRASIQAPLEPTEEGSEGP